MNLILECNALNYTLLDTTVFTLDMEEPIHVVKQFDSTLKYALFTIVRDIVHNEVLTVMDVFTVKNFFIKEELNQYVGHFNKTELKTENNNSDKSLSVN
jgi:hypothetical protein